MIYINFYHNCVVIQQVYISCMTVYHMLWQILGKINANSNFNSKMICSDMSFPQQEKEGVNMIGCAVNNGSRQIQDITSFPVNGLHFFPDDIGSKPFSFPEESYRNVTLQVKHNISVKYVFNFLILYLLFFFFFFFNPSLNGQCCSALRSPPPLTE